jgi:hypothetical protein
MSELVPMSIKGLMLDPVSNSQSLISNNLRIS